MAPACRVAALVLCALAAPSESARFSHTKAQAELALVHESRSGAWLTADCQDYPEDLGFGLGDTVRIFKKDSPRENNFVGLVGCQSQEEGKEGLVCLEGVRGCYAPEELRHVSSLVFTLNTMKNTMSHIFTAVADDVQDQWRDVKLGLSFFASQLSAKFSYIAGELHQAVNVCDADDRAATSAKFNGALASIKSRLGLVVDSAAQRWADAKQGVASVAQTTTASLVKLEKQLVSRVGEFYDAHLKETVDALKTYLGGIAHAVTNVPDALNPVPDGLVQAIEKFADKMAELVGFLASKASAAYDALASVIGSVSAGTGRLVAAVSERWSEVKTAVSKMASAAYAKMQQWSLQALEAACNFSVRDTAKAAFDKLQSAFKQAVDAVKWGFNYVKETLQDAADGIAMTLSTVATYIKDTSVKLWESETVQGALAAIKEEIRVLKELIVQQATLVQRFVGGFLGYFGRFVPQWVKSKLKTAHDKAKELAVKIRADIAELMGKATDGETENIEVDDGSVTDM